MFESSAKVLMLHNFYQRAGGEDQVFRAEAALLESHGHRVIRFTAHNDSIEDSSRLNLAADTVWNQKMYRDLRRTFREEKPDVAHFHNTFPLVSPSAYYAARAEGVPVVQTLHNYRLICLTATLYRDGSACEDCVGRVLPLPGISHSCYRNSKSAGGAVAAMLVTHRLAGTWAKKVDKYIALTDFARQKLIEGGLPAHKVVIKPNFVTEDPGKGLGNGGYFLFVGRLSSEKGIVTMLEAWSLLGDGIILKIAGDGPLENLVTAESEANPNVEYLGNQTGEEITRLMKGAVALIMPSKCYEGFPMVIAEAYSTGLPVISSKLGSMSSLILNGLTGLHFMPGAANDLASKVEQILQAPDNLREMRKNAREQFLTRYSSEKNYAQLKDVYESVLRKGTVNGQR